MDFTHFINKDMDMASLFTKLLIARNRELGNYKEVWKCAVKLDCTYRADNKKSSRFAHLDLKGRCSEDYEPVKDHLKRMLLSGGEENLQCCVYVGDECVVDMYGTAIGDKFFSPTTILNIMSCGKNWESIVMAMLFDKGLFQYEDLVSKHWPAFAKNGKGNITIADVFRHQAGLAWFTEAFPTIKDLWTSSIKENRVGAFIENQTLHFPEISKSEYHGMSRGLIINEIVRRIDPKGRTMGEIIKEEFKIKGLYLGYSEDANSDPIPGNMPMDSNLVPGFEERPPFCLELKGMAIGQDLITSFTTPDFVKAEVSSSNCRANARSMAKLASIMANKGHGLMSEDAWNEMHADATYDLALDGHAHFNFTKGGVNYFVNCDNATDIDKEHLNKNREGYYGWFGLGGSLMQWHPELKIGFAFGATFMNSEDMLNQRGARLQEIVKQCATVVAEEKMMEFPCKTCDHMAESRLALQQHCVQAHFRCNQCQKRFFEKKGIVNHLANVHGEKDHIYLID